MRVHALIAIYQMSAGACTALNLSTIENEIPVILNSKLLSGPANTSHIHLKAAPNRGVKISAMNAEERGFLNYLLKEWHPVHAFQDLDVVKKRQNLVGNKDVIKWRDRLLKFWSDGKTFGYDDFTNLIDENQPSENLVPVYVWFRETPRLTKIADKKLAEIVRASQQTEETFQSLFKSGVNPETLFQILDFESDSYFRVVISIDEVFKRWFEYVIFYRSASKGQATYEIANLYHFLLQRIEKEDAMVRVLKHLCNDEKLKSITTDMYRYVILNPTTRNLVFQAMAGQSPHLLYRILDLENEVVLEESNKSLFLAWLDYVIYFCEKEKKLDRASNIPYTVLKFLYVLSPMSLDKDVMKTFMSSEFAKLMDDVQKIAVAKDTKELLDFLKVPHGIKEWLDASIDPADLVETTKFPRVETNSELLHNPRKAAKNLEISGVSHATSLQNPILDAETTTVKITSIDIGFLKWITYTSTWLDAYPDNPMMELRQELSCKTYTNELRIVLSILQKINSYTKVATRLLEILT